MSLLRALISLPNAPAELLDRATDLALDSGNYDLLCALMDVTSLPSSARVRMFTACDSTAVRRRWAEHENLSEGEIDAALNNSTDRQVLASLARQTCVNPRQMRRILDVHPALATKGDVPVPRPLLAALATRYRRRSPMPLPMLAALAGSGQLADWLSQADPCSVPPEVLFLPLSEAQVRQQLERHLICPASDGGLARVPWSMVSWAAAFAASPHATTDRLAELAGRLRLEDDCWSRSRRLARKRRSLVRALSSRSRRPAWELTLAAHMADTTEKAEAVCDALSSLNGTPAHAEEAVLSALALMAKTAPLTVRSARALAGHSISTGYAVLSRTDLDFEAFEAASSRASSELLVTAARHFPLSDDKLASTLERLGGRIRMRPVNGTVLAALTPATLGVLLYGNPEWPPDAFVPLLAELSAADPTWETIVTLIDSMTCPVGQAAAAIAQVVAPGA